MLVHNKQALTQKTIVKCVVNNYEVAKTNFLESTNQNEYKIIHEIFLNKWFHNFRKHKKTHPHFLLTFCLNKKKKT